MRKFGINEVAGIRFAPSRLVRLLFLLALGFFLLASTTPAGAFKVGRDGNGKVIVFDNDYLDRRFGRTWVPEKPAGIEASAGSEEQPNKVEPNHPPADGIRQHPSPRQAAALRLAEKGRTALQNGQPRDAVHYFERALGIDARPFMHFYLSRAYYQLADYQGALRFLEVAESGLHGQPAWIGAFEILRRELSHARGRTEVGFSKAAD